MHRMITMHAHPLRWTDRHTDRWTLWQ